MKTNNEVKKLTRPQDGRMIAGVAAGMATYFNVDVSLVRLLWVLLLLPGGFPGVIGYLACWLIIPERK